MLTVRMKECEILDYLQYLYARCLHRVFVGEGGVLDAYPTALEGVKGNAGEYDW